MRSWYYASIVPVLFLVLACLVDFCIESAARRRIAIRVIMAIIAVQQSLAFFLLARPHVGEVDKYSMAVVLNRSLADGTRIGSWNAGLYGYFFERGPVVGLDGLVSNPAARHVLNHSLGKFIAESNIDYLVDSEGAFRYASPFLGLTRDVLWPPQDPLYEVWGEKEKSMIVAVPNPLRGR
jgi:hypothetical protein